MRLSLITFLLIFIALANIATAQNFQPFRNKYQYQFTYTGYISNSLHTGLIHSIEIDSAALINGDSVFYFNKLYVYENNFWGNAMVEKPGGEYLFLIKNYNQFDTVIVKTQLALGSQWTYNLDNTLYTVTYDHYAPETVLTNQTDFVQTYIVENTTGFKDSIKLSENFGLVYSFPFTNKGWPQPNHFNLTYILTTKVGVNKLNYFDYFTYDLGDVLVYEPNLTYPNLPPVGNDVFKVLSKTISLNGDTITYSFSRCHIDAVSGNAYSTTQSHCELIVTECSVLGNFPYTSVLSFPTNKSQVFCAIASDFRFNLNDNPVLYITLPYVFEQSFSSYIFQKDIGLGMYNFNGGMYYPNTSYSRIQYLKQPNIDDNCDNIEILMDTKTLHASSTNVIVAPNPFDHALSLTASDLKPGSWNVRIVSALGVEVYTSTIIISSSNQQIDLANLTALNSGIYFLSLENESQVYSQKIVKK